MCREAEMLLEGLRMSARHSTKAKLFRWKRAYQTGTWEADLASAEAMTADALRQINWDRRRQLVRHCALHVPFYRERFRRIGFHPDDLTSESVFSELPVLEKEEIREHREELVTEGLDRRLLRASATGGTTGHPLEIYHDARVPLSVLTWRMLNWWGIDVSDNSGYLYRAVPKGLRRRVADVALFPTRRAYIQASEMDKPRMRAFHSAINRIRARYLIGYVGAIEAFADFLGSTGLRVPTLQAVWTTAAPLPQLKRLSFQKTFECPVFTQYGSVEVFILSAECICQTGLHVFTDIRHVEAVGYDCRPTSGGEHGDLVVTDLTNYAFPLLRYRIGDRGRIMEQSCSCGRPFPLMDYVTGRVSDQIRLPDGTSVPGEFWTTIFDDWPAEIKGFEVHQSRDYAITVRYEPSNADCGKAIDSVGRMLSAKLRGLVQLSFVQGTLDPNRNGKTRYVVSEAIRTQR
jgi:phenylacetate-CoA ligase